MSATAPQQLLDDAALTETALTKIFDDLANASAPQLVDAMRYAAMAGVKRKLEGLELGAARLASDEYKPQGAGQVAASFRMSACVFI